LNGVGVVGSGWIVVGNGDGLVVFDGVGEGQNNGGTVDCNASDVIVGGTVCCDGEGRGASGCGIEGLVVGENNGVAVSGGFSRYEGWRGASNGGVIGNGLVGNGNGVIARAVLNGVGVVGSGWIVVGNGDGLVVFDGVGEGQNNGGT